MWLILSAVVWAVGVVLLLALLRGASILNEGYDIALRRAHGDMYLKDADLPKAA